MHMSRHPSLPPILLNVNVASTLDYFVCCFFIAEVLNLALSKLFLDTYFELCNEAPTFQLLRTK